MALTTCKECGGKVSTKASACPACGAKTPPRTSTFTWVVTGFIVVLVARCALTADSSPSSTKPVAASATSTPNKPPPAPSAPPDPKFIKELVRIENLTAEVFCTKELRKLKGKKGAPPQPWFDALAQAGRAHGIAGDHLVNIQAGGVVPGMNRCGALAAWGRPEKVNTTTSANSTREQWVYGNGNYLYFRNEILTSIQN